MTAVLIDTDVFSFLFKRDTRAALYAHHLAGAQACLCFQTVAELRSWALVRQWGQPRRQRLDASLARCVVLPYDDAMTQAWAEVTFRQHQIGRPIACGDAWIAAAALRHGLPLLTHNAADYGGIPNLEVITGGRSSQA